MLSTGIFKLKKFLKKLLTYLQKNLWPKFFFFFEYVVRFFFFIFNILKVVIVFS